MTGNYWGQELKEKVCKYICQLLKQYQKQIAGIQFECVISQA
jgi:hypothetical protein